MNPVRYHSMQVKHVSGGHPDLVSDRVLNTSNVFTADDVEFKQHILDHRGRTKFYCFYCNKVSFSEAELNIHLKEHNSKYPYVCPHCRQGYMRRQCLVKHIERLHSGSGGVQVPAKPGTTKNSHVPVSGALFSVPITDAASLRPAVRVKVPALSTPAVRLGRDEQRGKTLDTKVSNATTANGLAQQSRALTVSLPEEVTIPAGCLVELVEVKTVNGTKELKLRLVSQQENESVIKDTRTAVTQNATLGKPFLSTLNHANAVKSMSMGMCTVNRKQCETKAVSVERPAVVPGNISKNLPSHVNIERGGLKRKSQEIINLECHTVVPNKVPKSIFNPVREGDGGIKVAQREPVTHNGALPSVTSNRLVSRLTTSTLHPDNRGASVSQRAMDEKNHLIPEHSKSIQPRRASDINIKPRDVAIKLEPGMISHRNNTSSPVKKEAVGLDLQKSAPSLSVLLNSAAKVGPPASLVHKDGAGNSSFLLPRFLNLPSAAKRPGLPNRTPNSKISAWTQDVRFNERAGEGDTSEPESFPIISSVFSLSQQPEDVQGSMQPLVMALRGIVMDKSNGSSSTQDPVKIINSTEQVREAPASAFCAQVAASDGSVIRKLLLTGQTSECVKVEALDKGIQHLPARTHIPVEEERSSATPTDNKKCCPALASKSTDEESVASHVSAPEPLQQMTKMEHDIPKFLTVSLKRVQVGVWKKSRKGLKLRISKYKTQVPMGCAVIYPMPLKKDQLVKRPGPNQPVVVLNHPNPRASAQAAGADTLSDTGASEVAPKCQILKMRLSKVMGQKYEVMGCTVGVFP